MRINARLNDCRTCGATTIQAGDGWDGECGDCADLTMQGSGPVQTERKKPDDTEGGTCD